MFPLKRFAPTILLALLAFAAPASALETVTLPPGYQLTVTATGSDGTLERLTDEPLVPRRSSVATVTAGTSTARGPYAQSTRWRLSSSLTYTMTAAVLPYSTAADGTLTVAPAGAEAFVIGGEDTTTIKFRTDGGDVDFDGTLDGVAPAGITADTSAGTWLFTKDATGTVVITSADDDSTAALTVDPGGNAALTLGSASDTVAVAATGGIASDAVYGQTATTLALGNTISTAASICNSAACDTITIGTNTDADTITIGESNDTAVSITDNNWSIGVGGIATFAHQRFVNGSTFTAANPNVAKATLQAANFFLVDTTSNAVDVDFADDAPLDAADIGSTWMFVVSVGGTNALTVTAGASGVTTIKNHTVGAAATAEDVGDFIRCTAYAADAIRCEISAAD